MFQLATRLDLVSWRPRHPLAGWAERSQRAACRNAMAATTALAEQRREREEVAAYLETVLARRAGEVAAAPGARTRALG